MPRWVTTPLAGPPERAAFSTAYRLHADGLRSNPPGHPSRCSRNVPVRRHSVSYQGAYMIAVLFDMDGLLIDSEPLWLEAETAVIRRLGGEPWTEADQQQLLGGSLDRTVRYLRAKASVP